MYDGLHIPRGSLSTETVESAARALEGVDNVKSSDGLAVYWKEK